MSAERQVVMVTGPGRSGTSTMAGALVELGLAVPGRALPGNATNPRGFFEPAWAVPFHRRLLEDCGVGTLDPVPTARDRVAKRCGRPDVREELAQWLSRRLDEQPRVVVKDPRLIWFVPLWTEVARDLGVEPTHVVMLRHPAEVAGSRERYYRGPEASTDPAELRAHQIGYVAGWTNVLLQTEAVTRGARRAFVRYPDLVAGWRTQLTRVDTSLGLGLRGALAADPSPVDALIDPALHRVRADGWQGVDVPGWLQDLGERTWQTFGRLADDEQEDTVLDDVRALTAAYEGEVRDAVALTRNARRRARLGGYRRGLREAAEHDRPGLVERVRRRLTR